MADAPPTSGPAPKAAGLSSMLAALAALTAVAAALLHFVGFTMHRSYLRFWGIDSDMFPKPPDWLLISGYYGAVDRFAATLRSISGEVFLFLLVAFGTSLYLALLLSPASFGADGLLRLLSRVPLRIRGFVRRSILAFLVILLAPLGLIGLTTLMALPAALGELAGTSAAERQIEDFKQGCTAPKVRCVDLRRDGNAFATGPVLDSSPTHIVIFDVKLGRARLLSRDGVEVVASPPSR